MAQSVTSSKGGDAYVRPPAGWVLSVATVRLRWSLEMHDIHLNKLFTDIHCI